MKKHFGKTAILVFTRTDEQEASVKTFVQGAGENSNKVIARRLIRQTVSVARKTQLPVFVVSGNRQTGSTFGERFANAIESAFAEGYQNVVSIGNDCPALTSHRLLRAAKELENKGLVLGPATDGGVYLLGISKNSYDRASFLTLPWETADLQQGFHAYAAGFSGSVVWLEQKSDIDNEHDLRATLHHLGLADPFRRALAGLLAAFQKIRSTFQLPSFSNIYPEAITLRGPPAIFPNSI